MKNFICKLIGVLCIIIGIPIGAVSSLCLVMETNDTIDTNIVVETSEYESDETDIYYTDDKINDSPDMEIQIENVYLESHAETKFVIENELLSAYQKANDSYFNSIFDWQKYNGDFNKDKLVMLCYYCDKYEVPIEIMLSIISWESSFKSTAVSPESTAAGYCQVIAGTAKDIYENTLQYGTYDAVNHDSIMTECWDINLEIGCCVLKQYYMENYMSWEHAIYAYHGGTSENNLEYFNNINTRLYELFNISVCDIDRGI